MADERITVSRDALRADLAELELRIIRGVAEQLQHKADATEVVALRLAVEKWGQGELTPAQLRAIDARIELANDGRTDRRWTRRDQLSAVLSMCVGMAALILSVVLSIKGVG